MYFFTLIDSFVVEQVMLFTFSLCNFGPYCSMPQVRVRVRRGQPGVYMPLRALSLVVVALARQSVIMKLFKM